MIFINTNMNSTIQLSQPSSIGEGISLSNARETFEFFMALTPLLVLTTAIFFLSLFSIYIRRRITVGELSPQSSAASFSSRQSSSSYSNRGLDISTVNSLPLVACSKARTHPIIGDCPICLSEFRDRETVRCIPNCGHEFHPRCIDTWLRSHVTCPLCRSAQLFKSGGEEVRLDVK